MTTPSIEVIETTIAVEVVDEGGVEVVELIHPGPQGPASAFYVHSQPVPSATWSINHNLGFRPSVEVFDSGSQEIEADVSHPSVNTASILFTVPIAGFARLT